MTKKNDGIQQAVLERIQTGDVHMRPRIFFVLISLIGVTATIMASIVMAYLTSMMIFITRITTADTPAYGARQNLAESFASFPWWALILAVGLFAIGVIILRKYSRLYRVHLRTVIALVAATVLVLGLLLFSLNIGHSGENGPQNTHSMPHRISGS